MTTTSADLPALVVVDTNVLLAASDEARASHHAALDLLNHDTRRLAVTSQIVREYLAVSTRPVEANGLGMEGAKAVANVQVLLEDMALLPENAECSERVMGLVRQGRALGKQVHDANVVAVAVSHRAGVIVTDNVRHFDRFSDLIQIESLGG